MTDERTPAPGRTVKLLMRMTKWLRLHGADVHWPPGSPWRPPHGTVRDFKNFQPTPRANSRRTAEQKRAEDPGDDGSSRVD